jgi:CubicO group peptidase (beta-lactamase class C family)
MRATEHPVEPVQLQVGPLADAVANLLDPAFGGAGGTTGDARDAFGYGTERDGEPVHPAAAAVPAASARTAPPPGALAAVRVDGRVSYAVGGFAQRIHGREPVEMAWTTRTDAGSVSKILGTTAALLALVDAGVVDLDAPVTRHLPLPDRAGPPITPRCLLEHRAGLWEWWPLYLSAARGDAAADLAAQLPPRYPAGAGRHYSDLGFMLLGQLVARAAGHGHDLAAAVDELVLRPFGLTETRYRAPAPGAPVAASAHGDEVEYRMVESGEPYPVPGRVADFAGWRRHVLVGEVDDGNAFHAFGGAAGHAGLFTTAGDLLRFGEALLRCLDGEGPVRRETAAAFLAPGRDPGQALGFQIWDGPWGRAIGHPGFPGVAFAVLPRRRAAVAMVTNRLHAPGPEPLRPTDAMWLRVLAAADAHVNALR